MDHDYKDKHEKMRREPLVSKILGTTEKLKKKGEDISILEISHLEYPFLKKIEQPKNIRIIETQSEESLRGQFEIEPKECTNCQSKFGTFKSPVPCGSCIKFFCKDCCSRKCKKKKKIILNLLNLF